MLDFSPQLRVVHGNETTLIHFPATDMGEEAAQAIGPQLGALADTLGCRRFVLNLGAVRCLSSAMLGKLIGFHKKVRQRGGELTLCALSPEVAARFESMRLDKLFHICSTEEALGGVPAGVS